MSEAPISLTFFDAARGVHGMARAGLTLLFEGSTPRAAGGGPQVERTEGGFHALLDDRLELDFEPAADPAEMAGSRVRVCRVRGQVEGRPIDCLGTAAETLTPPEWDGLDALRAVSALFDPEHAVLAVARRPRGAHGHGEELVSAVLLAGGALRAVEEARISTTYDGEGRQRSAGLELWMPDEDFPRRVSGELTGGTTLELAGLRINASVFNWRMEGREGAGSYELTVRDEPPEAA